MNRITVLIMILFLSVAYNASADDDHRFPMDLHDLGLSKQQHRLVEEAMKEYQSSYRSYHHHSKKAQENLSALFLSPSFDSETYRTKSLEEEKISIEIRVRLFEKLHAILTPEQKRLFVRHLKEWDSE